MEWLFKAEKDTPYIPPTSMFINTHASFKRLVQNLIIQFI